MKKINSIIVICLLAAGIWSCSKTTEYEPVKKNPEMYTDQERSEAIISFNNELESKEKSNTSYPDMSIEEVVLISEAVFNQKYSWPEQEYNDFYSKEIMLEVAISDGEKVNHGNRVAMFNRLKKEINDHFREVQEPKKHLHVVDLELVGLNGALALLKATSIVAANTTNYVFGNTDW